MWEPVRPENLSQTRVKILQVNYFPQYNYKPKLFSIVSTQYCWHYGAWGCISKSSLLNRLWEGLSVSELWRDLFQYLKALLRIYKSHLVFAECTEITTSTPKCEKVGKDKDQQYNIIKRETNLFIAGHMLFH